MTYCTFPIRGEPFDRYWEEGDKEPLFRLIREEGLKREFPLIISTLKAFARGRVRIEGGRVLSADGEVAGGYDLTEEINSELHLL